NPKTQQLLGWYGPGFLIQPQFEAEATVSIGTRNARRNHPGRRKTGNDRHCRVLHASAATPPPSKRAENFRTSMWLACGPVRSEVSMKYRHSTTFPSAR